VPPSRRSLPGPPLSLSFPGPPLSLSLPARPQTRSLPAPALITSAPADPTMTSSPDVPLITPEPTIVAGMPKHIGGGAAEAPADTAAPTTSTPGISHFSRLSDAPATVAAAESGAGQILRDAGLNVVWFDCRVIESLDDPTDFCRQPLSPAEILLRLLPENSRHGIADDAFGFAVPPVLASIYYQHAVLLAASTGYGVPGILACVIAHELGHLLLGPRSHSEIGIMRGHWGRNELRLIAWGGLHFTPQQAKAIRAEAQMRMRRETTGIIVASSVDYDGRR